MKAITLWIAAILACAQPLGAATVQVGLSPYPVPLLDTESLTGTEHSAEVQRLEAELGRNAPASVESLALLASHYMAMDTIDSRSLALEHLRAARELDPTNVDLALAEARILERQGYLKPAMALIRSFVVEHGAQAELDEALGCLLFRSAVRTLNWDEMERSRSAYVRAVKADDSNDRTLRSLGSVAVAAADTHTTRIVMKRLLQRNANDAGVCLLAAVSAVDQDRGVASAQLLQRAIPLLSERNRVFAAHAGELLEATPGANIKDPARYWQALNPHPTWLVNQRQLEFLKRWVEAEILFGEGDFSQPVWETSLGDVWIRFGRPNASRFIPADPASLPLHVAGNLPDVYEDPYQYADNFVAEGSTSEPAPLPWLMAVELTREDQDRRNHFLGLYYWMGDEWLLVGFRDGTYTMNWKFTSHAASRMHQYTRRAPIYFREKPPTPKLTMRTAAAGYHRANGTVRLELYLAVDGYEPKVPAGPRVSWLLSTGAGLPLDRGESRLPGTVARSTLLKAAGAKPGEDHARMSQLSWILQPGSYHLALELDDPVLGFATPVEMNITLPAEPRDGMVVSDLLLVDTFRAYESDSGVPLDWVKHAHVVLPHFGAVDMGRREPLYVYFEVLGLGTDETGSTHFDVSYEIVPSAEFQFANAIQLDQKLRDRELFLEERSGVSADGLVVKGAQIDVDGLREGPYVLDISIHDRIRDRWATRRLPFAVKKD